MPCRPFACLPHDLKSHQPGFGRIDPVLGLRAVDRERFRDFRTDRFRYRRLTRVVPVLLRRKARLAAVPASYIPDLTMTVHMSVHLPLYPMQGPALLTFLFWRLPIWNAVTAARRCAGAVRAAAAPDAFRSCWSPPAFCCCPVSFGCCSSDPRTSPPFPAYPVGKGGTFHVRTERPDDPCGHPLPCSGALFAATATGNKRCLLKGLGKRGVSRRQPATKKRAFCQWKSPLLIFQSRTGCHRPAFSNASRMASDLTRRLLRASAAEILPSTSSTSSRNARAESRSAPCPKIISCSALSEVATRTRWFFPIS